MKKLTAIIVCIMLLSSLFVSATVVSAEVVTGTCGTSATWSYNTETKTFTISGTGSTADYLGNPSDPDHYYLAKPWDAYVGEIETVVVEEGITRLGDAVLMSYPALTSVSLPSTLVDLGSSNILDCNVLTALTLPEGLEVIGSSSVSGCHHLGEIYIPASLREVHWCALMYLNNLLDPDNPEEQNDLNIYYSGTEEQWAAIDFCDADYFIDPDYPIINWTRIWLLSGNYINLIMHYNWEPADFEVTCDGTVIGRFAPGETVELPVPANKTINRFSARFFTWEGESVSRGLFDENNDTANKRTYTMVMPAHDVTLTSGFVVIGDTDGTLNTDAKDVARLKKIVVGSVNVSSTEFEAADVNLDGAYDAKDIKALKGMI